MTLNDFAQESRPGSNGPRAITIADVLASSTPLHWDEAVATMQDVIDLVSSMHRDDIPAFEDIVIEPAGTLTILGTRRGESGPVAAGRALHSLMATADVPVALRLFVSQANAPETYDSLAAFAKALAYYGKSDRAGLIREIYARYAPTAAITPTQAGAAHTPTPPVSPPPLPSAPRSSEKVAIRPAVRRSILAVAAIVTGVTAVIVFALVFGRGALRHIAALTVTAQEETTEAPSSTASVDANRTQKNATSGSVARPGRPSDARGAGEARSTQAGIISPPRVAVTPPSRSPRTPRDASTQIAQLDPTRAGSLPEVPSRPAVSLFPLATASPVRKPVGAVYSRDDVDVQPPVMLQPQLPPPLMIGGPSEGTLNRMELIVASDGSVERVRLMSAPRRMADMMLLSGAKLWRFAPAVKNGEPVRYKTIVSWVAFP